MFRPSLLLPSDEYRGHSMWKVGWMCSGVLFESGSALLMAILAWCYATMDVTQAVWATLPLPVAVFDFLVLLLGLHRLHVGRAWLLTSELHVRYLLLFSFLFRLLSSLTLSLVLLDFLPLTLLPVPPCMGYLGGVVINMYAGDSYTWIRLHVLDLVVSLTCMNVVLSSLSASPWSASCLLYPVFAVCVAFVALTLLLWYVLITDAALRRDTLLRLAVNLLLHLSFSLFLSIIFLAQFMDQRQAAATELLPVEGVAGAGAQPGRRGSDLFSVLVSLFSPLIKHVDPPVKPARPLQSEPESPATPDGTSLLSPDEEIRGEADMITATYWAIPLLFALLLVQIFAGSWFVFLVASHTDVSSPPESPFLSLSAPSYASGESRCPNGASGLRGPEEALPLTCNMRVTLEKVGHHFYRILHSPGPDASAEQVAFLRDAFPFTRHQKEAHETRKEDMVAALAQETRDTPLARSETSAGRQGVEVDNSGDDREGDDAELEFAVAVDLSGEAGKGEGRLACEESWRGETEGEIENPPERRLGKQGRDKSGDKSRGVSPPSGAAQRARRECEGGGMSESRGGMPDSLDGVEKVTGLPVSPEAAPPTVERGRRSRNADAREDRDSGPSRTNNIAQGELKLDQETASAVVSADGDPLASASPLESVCPSPSSLPSSLPRDAHLSSSSSLRSSQPIKCTSERSARPDTIQEARRGAEGAEGVGEGEETADGWEGRRERAAAAEANEQKSGIHEGSARTLSTLGEANQSCRPKGSEGETSREQPLSALRWVNRTGKEHTHSRLTEGARHPGEAASGSARVEGVSSLGAEDISGEQVPSSVIRRQGRAGSKVEVGGEDQRDKRDSLSVTSPRQTAGDEIGSPSKAPSRASSGGQTDEGDLCIICFQSRPNAVLLFCGHGGLCFHCAQTCFRRNGRCPTCRQAVKGVVELQDESCQVEEERNSQKRDGDRPWEKRGDRRAVVTATVKDVKKS
ncbi:zinc finger, C3HC4 type (RING finger) domain-containing protein [Toxoplasma gondii GT1]|uniref:Zinc finger, C3HC4 type (RING finger) domain-containing protein n=4 Tax=Toxoplasma gondii TaxID=5811 RepID=S7UTV1_TOXGG|nr:zinc finger, C3HC4 type (RING finger) domain-containing protein [Toxoplasma gondii GT1]KAF4642602.1 zinc finger, C3HC4 type (RING finger) domain-containing protein [Toxoplasma gondii]KFG38364.1 zinc finger, C3HC4 type (RING finger) domain-containing protein [Toxoplasma gondii FOU]RQX72913.1 zinc finger, C3HC4 type (RING finger) domain-containing protein [Toxoplasma gondii CAST]